LEALYCDNNQFTTLNVTGLTALTAFECGFNRLTTLDVTAGTAL
jgi:hypothetical protein